MSRSLSKDSRGLNLIACVRTSQYSRLGIGGAGSLLGGLAVLFIPVPFILVKYGSQIRHKSKRAKHDEDED